MKLSAVAAAALLAGCTASAVERRPAVQETTPPPTAVTPEPTVAATPGDADVAPGSASARLAGSAPGTTTQATALVATASAPAASPHEARTESAPPAAAPGKAGDSSLEPVDAYLSQLARRRPLGQPEATKEPDSPASAGSTGVEPGAQPARRKPIVSQPQAPQRYAGAHPKPEVLGDGWCQVEGVHEHPYPPEDSTLFELEAGVYRFTGPVQLTYFDFHPKPSGGWCQAPGPHPHSYLPPPPYQTSFEYDSEGHHYVYRPRDGAPKKPTQFVPAASDQELAGSEDGTGTGPEAGTTSRGNAIRATALGRTEYAESTEGRGDFKEESGSERREGASSGQPGAAGLPREMVSRQGSSGSAGRQTSSLNAGFKAPPRRHHHHGGGHHGGGHHGGGHHGGGHHGGGGHHPKPGGDHHGGGHHGGGHHRDGHHGGHRGPRR